MLSSFRAVLLLTILTAFIYHSTLWEISASTTGLSGDAGAASASEAGKAAEDLSSASGDHSGYITGSMTGKPAAVPKGTTTMYVSSWLSGRHGLCVLLENVDQAGNHRFGMIDTGNVGSAAMKSFLQSHGVKSLEFLILTHMHDDHIGNAVYLLKNYPVKSLYLKQFDAHWSDGLQATYEKILRAAASNASTKKITGVSYALSISKAASPSASAGLISWLQSHADCKSRFKGLFTDSNISFGFGSSKVQLFNWEIWSTDGVTRWQPGRTKRCRAAAFANENSDNHFSLGVRVTQGSRRFWIGGDMNNLRLVHKKGSPYKGDEDRIRASVGRVDAMVMNHHGRGGSNTPSFLRTLSPSYAVYTSLRLEVESSSSDRARTSFLYLRNNLHVPEDHILWACNHWKFYPEDPVITISSSELVSTKKDGTDMTHWKGAGGANCAVIHLIPAHSYTSYDLTGDGKADRIQIFSRGSGKLRSSLTIRVNQKDVFSFKKNYSDAQPVTLLLQPGHRAFLCISILSPKDEKSRILRLYRCRTVSAVPSLEKTFDFIQKDARRTLHIWESSCDQSLARQDHAFLYRPGQPWQPDHIHQQPGQWFQPEFRQGLRQKYGQRFRTRFRQSFRQCSGQWLRQCSRQRFYVRTRKYCRKRGYCYFLPDLRRQGAEGRLFGLSIHAWKRQPHLLSGGSPLVQYSQCTHCRQSASCRNHSHCHSHLQNQSRGPALPDHDPGWKTLVDRVKNRPLFTRIVRSGYFWEACPEGFCP